MLYDILIDFGVPIVEDNKNEKGEVREHWGMIRDLIFKGKPIDERCNTTNSLRERVEQIKLVERFVSQMHIVS